jgi:protein-S-isoprenylcysteine O-methyltransferase Ste14
MRAANWEFKNRALVFGLIFGLGFAAYVIARPNPVAALPGSNDAFARLMFALATCLLVIAAFFRTWASAYLQAQIVYAAQVKTESLVADGPYRHTRNPLYFANVLLALGLGSMMSPAGFILAVILMLIFSYRLIFREEADLEASQGERYRVYKRAVPRLWPALTARIPSAGSQPAWADGFKAEFWCWGFAVAIASVAVTLSSKVFFATTAASIAIFWISSSLLPKKKRT